MKQVNNFGKCIFNLKFSMPIMNIVMLFVNIFLIFYFHLFLIMFYLKLGIIIFQIFFIKTFIFKHEVIY